MLLRAPSQNVNVLLSNITFITFIIFAVLGSLTTLTLQGHVTSSVTWPLDSGWVISYWWSIGPKSLSLTVSEIFRPKHHVLIDTMPNHHCACAISR